MKRKMVIKPDEEWKKALNDQAEADWAEYEKSILKFPLHLIATNRRSKKIRIFYTYIFSLFY